MGVLEVRTPGRDEYELPGLPVPATSANVPFDLANLRHGGRGEKYVELTVTNASASAGTLRDPAGGRSLQIQSGQTASWDLDPGADFVSYTPAGDITAGQVVIVARIRRGM